MAGTARAETEASDRRRVWLIVALISRFVYHLYFLLLSALRVCFVGNRKKNYEQSRCREVSEANEDACGLRQAPKNADRVDLATSTTGDGKAKMPLGRQACF